MQHIENEQFRKACLLSHLKAGDVIFEALNRGRRDAETERDYLMLHSNAVRMARLHGEKDVIPCLLAVRKVIGDFWKAFHECEDEDDIVSVTGESMVAYKAAANELDDVAALHFPIETREWSIYYPVSELRERAGVGGVEMAARTWQRKRTGNPSQTENHPQSGAQRVRVTRQFNDLLSLNLPDFAKE